MTTTANRLGSLKFLTPETQSSLYRNDLVRMVRDERGNFVESLGVSTEERALVIGDARQLASSERMSLQQNGFELLDAPTVSYDFLDHDCVTSRYYRDCEELVAACTGGRVWAFDHNVRSAGGQADKRREKGGQDVQAPAHIVHGDYTLRSAPERLMQLTQPPSVNDTLRSTSQAQQGLIPQDAATQALSDSGRFSIINVWRNIQDVPVLTHPLALGDGLKMEPEDLVVFEIHMPDRIGENYWSKYHEQQKFYYYPEMTRNEALLIKQWDSGGMLARTAGGQADNRGGGGCTFSFHSAFHPQQTPKDAPDRWSIEVRCAVIH